MPERQNSTSPPLHPLPYMSPIEGPHCGCEARLISCVRHARAEERTFECAACNRPTYVTVGVPRSVWNA